MDDELRFREASMQADHGDGEAANAALRALPGELKAVARPVTPAAAGAAPS
ncbi:MULTISPECIES: hypothetical protein [unclassified Streptomyces]|uniref:hypothetical protein n=1 Tax=unclassified Streptomyces TaxID=2593676 RepID=UPI00380FF32E